MALRLGAEDPDPSRLPICAERVLGAGGVDSVLRRVQSSATGAVAAQGSLGPGPGWPDRVSESAQLPQTCPGIRSGARASWHMGPVITAANGCCGKGSNNPKILQDYNEHPSQPVIKLVARGSFANFRLRCNFFHMMVVDELTLSLTQLIYSGLTVDFLHSLRKPTK